MSRRKIFMRGAALALAAVLTAGTGGNLPVRAGEDGGKEVTPLANPNKIEVTAVNDDVPVFEYGKEKEFSLNIKNPGKTDITDFKIEPDLQGSDSSKWPFKTSKQKYVANVEKIGKDGTEKVSFKFTERDDVPTARYTIHFKYTYKVADESEGSDEKYGGESSFFVRTTAKPEEKKEDTKKIEIIDNRNKEDDSTKKEELEGGSVDNGDVSYSGGGGGEGGEGDGSVPRVIVTGFDTEPKEVKAGTDFILKIHLKNTSRKTRVKNMLFDLNSPEEGGDEQTTAPAFLPSSGSSSIYLEGMKANGTADIAIKLNAKSDLLQKPYSVELSMKYEDSSGGSVEASSSLSIPIKQDARYEFSDFEITPASISIDDEANVMCNLYNLGRIKLYNVKAIFEGNCIEKEEIFVGNVESGATASIDAMLKGVTPSQGPEPVTMTMSYENEEGEVTTDTKELMLEVTDSSEEVGMEGEMMPMDEEGAGGPPIIPIVIAIGLIAVIAAAVIILKMRKKKLAQNQEEELLYELDGSSEDE